VHIIFGPLARFNYGGNCNAYGKRGGKNCIFQVCLKYLFQNMLHSDKCLANYEQVNDEMRAETLVGRHVKCPLFQSYFTQNRNWSILFTFTLPNVIFHENPISRSRTVSCVRTDVQSGLIGAAEGYECT
jgi:hypothetical protein